jgi:hypothetical protein
VRHVLVVLAVAGLGALMAWSCATSTTATGARTTQRPSEVAPDGGWASYRPTHAEYEVDPARAAVGQPSTSPIFPIGHDLH